MQNSRSVGGSLSRLLQGIFNIESHGEFFQIASQLDGIEGEIRNSRRDFNESVNSYNVKLRSFPMNLFGGMFGFKAKEV